MASPRAPQKKKKIENTVSLRAPVWQACGPHATKRTKIEEEIEKGVPLEPARRVCTINRGQKKNERKRRSDARIGTARCGGTILVAFKGCVP